MSPDSLVATPSPVSTTEPRPASAWSPDAILLIGHGTRDAAGLDEARRLTQLVGARSAPTPVALAFLELAEPDIPGAVEALYQQGARRLTIVPLLLFSAGHAREDIPAILQELQSRRSDLQFRVADTLDCDERLLELSALRLQETLDAANWAADESLLLLLVGRGSRDRRANAEFARFARLRWEGLPRSRVETAFVAMTHPSLETAVRQIRTAPQKQIVVQPHLMFGGDLLRQVGQRVAQALAQEDGGFGILVNPGHGNGELGKEISSPDSQKWRICGHLGAHDLLAAAVETKAAQAATGSGRADGAR